MKVSLIQLGCPKNIVDGEWVLGQLVKAGHQIVPYEDCEVVLINTCGFIEEAKEESLNVIFECIEDKKRGKLKKIIVFGCLAERYLDELKKELFEVDGIFPLSVISTATEMLTFKKKRLKRGFLPLPEKYEDRFRITPSHYAYVKIGDGCEHKCSFCVIPKIRGKSSYRPIKYIVEELEQLADEGVKEAILVSQDSLSYGKNGEENIIKLIERLEKVKTPKWIRIMYLYPTKVNEKFIKTVANSTKVLPYFDLPLQHVSKKVLKDMKRGGSYKLFLNLIEKIRKEIKEAVIRSSFIVGFPTEGKRDFLELKRFILEAELDNVGFFKYSKEEGTEAFHLKNRVKKSVKEERFEELYLLQKEIVLKKNKEKLGKIFEVLVDGPSQEIDFFSEGRAYFQAPEIDNKIFINESNIKIGEFKKVKLKNFIEYDFIGEVVE